MEHNTRSKAEQEYVKTLIHNLSLQRLSDTEIADYLHNEKQIEIARTTVNRIRNTIKRSAERWYIDLKQSRYKYIANYKERLDSLLSYQKRLNDIITTTKRDEVKIRAISELHSIEKTIFDLWKQLPEIDIVNRVKQQQEELEQLTNEVDSTATAADADATWGDGWSSDASVSVLLTPTTTTEPEISMKTMQSDDKPNKDGDGEEWKQLQCPACHKCFMNNFTLSAQTQTLDAVDGLMHSLLSQNGRR